ncbi:MAG: glycosyltransferase, partial [Pseudomonadota bacterium]
MLRRLLDGWLDLEPVPGASVGFMVVDNDPAGSARPIVEGHRLFQGGRLSFDVEPRRGIPFARNRALDAAESRNTHAVAFMDDDEWPEAHWLRSLWQVLEETGVDAVAGQVAVAYPPGAPAWVHELPRVPLLNGRAPGDTSIKNCSTNNVLISKSIFVERGLRFDERFGLSGGSDTEFFVRSRTEGARFALAPDALVHEEVPLARLHWRWRLGRIISRSNAQVRIRIKHGGYWRSFALYLPRGVWLVLAAIVTLPG